jgi:hypothetical protein
MAEDLRSLVMEAIASRSGLSTVPTPQDLLTQLESTDPAMHRIVQYLMRRQDGQAEAYTSPDTEGDMESTSAQGAADEPQSNAKVRHFQRLRHMVEDMFAELQVLRSRNDTLAAALGACNLCWGEDPQCGDCGGRGCPGFATPQPKLFAEIVLPAARNFLKRKEEDRHPPGNTSSGIHGSMGNSDQRREE